MASFINTWPFSVIPKPLYLSNSASLIKIPIGIFTNEYFPVSSLYTIDKASLLFCIGFLVTSPVFSLQVSSVVPRYTLVIALSFYTLIGFPFASHL